jgi:hypothetical protein
MSLTPHQDTVIEDMRIEYPIVLTDPEGVAPQTLLEVTTGTGEYTIFYRAADASQDLFGQRPSSEDMTLSPI